MFLLLSPDSSPFIAGVKRGYSRLNKLSTDALTAYFGNWGDVCFTRVGNTKSNFLILRMFRFTVFHYNTSARKFSG